LAWLGLAWLGLAWLGLAWLGLAGLDDQLALATSHTTLWPPLYHPRTLNPLHPVHPTHPTKRTEHHRSWPTDWRPPTTQPWVRCSTRARARSAQGPSRAWSPRCACVYMGWLMRWLSCLVTDCDCSGWCVWSMGQTTAL